MDNISYVLLQLPGKNGKEINSFMGRAFRRPRDGDFDAIEAEIETLGIDNASIDIFCLDENFESATYELADGFTAQVIGPKDSRFNKAVKGTPFGEYVEIYKAEREALRYGLTVEEAALFIIKNCRAYQRVNHIQPNRSGKKRVPGGSKRKLLALINELQDIRELLDEEFENSQSESEE